MEIKVLKKNETLSYLAGINRPVNPTQVTKLCNSINRMGVTRPIVTADVDFITGIKRKYILDGQHLFNSMLRNNVPIIYTTIEIKDMYDLVETIALLNSSSKSWTMLDYVTSWTTVHEDYKKLLKYYQVYDFNVGFLGVVLSGKSTISNGGGSFTKTIKSGNFRIKEETRAINFLNMLTDILKIIPRFNRTQNGFVCNEYINFLTINSAKYRHDKFLVALEDNKLKFKLSSHEPHTLVTMFEQLL